MEQRLMNKKRNLMRTVWIFLGVMLALPTLAAGGEPELSVTPALLAAPDVMTAATGITPPLVATDKADYGPGEWAVVTGSGFGPGETVTLQVTHVTPEAAPGSGHDPWTVVAGADGAFTSRWFVDPDDSLGATFLLAASGGSSGMEARATFTDAAAPLSITPTSQTDLSASLIDTFWVDANKCNAEGPRGAWLSYEVKNTSTTATLTNVTVNFAGFTGGTSPTYFKAPTDLVRTFPSLAPQAVVPVYFYVDYAEICAHKLGNTYAGHTANYSVAATADGFSPPVTYGGSVRTNELLTAHAAGIAQSSVLGPGIFIGQLLTQTVTYSFGNNSNLFFQPAGEAAFPDSCIRLVGSEVTATSGGVTGILGQKNRLSFPTASVPGGGGTITVLYTWEVNCRNTEVTVHPWAAARSGNQYKYVGFASSTILSASLPTLMVDKTASPATQDSNGPITWSVVFANNSPVAVTLDRITDVLPSCMTISAPFAPDSQVTTANSQSSPAIGASGTVNWVGTGLGYPVGANSSLTLKYTTSSSGCGNGSFTNSATGLQGGTTVGPAATTVTIGLPAALNLAKSVSPVNFSAAGQTLTYTYVIKNIGSTSSVPGPFTVTDSKPLVVFGIPYPAGTPFPCGTGPLAPGATTSCAAAYTTTTADVLQGWVTNAAAAAGSGLTSGPAYETANYGGPALSLAKTLFPATFQGSGSTITYTYVIKNVGTTVLAGPFTVTDSKTLVVGGTSYPAMTPFPCGSGPLAPNATTSCTATYTITSADATAEFVTNTATVSGNGITSNPVQATAILAQTPGVTVVKSASPTSYTAAGQTVTYTYTVTNTGNTSLSTIRISDNRIGSPLGTPFTCVASLAAGASGTCTATYTVTAADVTAGTVTNTATATATSGSGGNAITISSDPASATVAKAAPALTMAKSVTETSFAAVGTVLHYSYLVKNTGNVAVSGPITITDNRINGGAPFQCSASGLAIGATVSCVATYTVTQADLNAGSVVNIASAAGVGVVSPTDSKTVVAVQSPAMTLAKVVSPLTFSGAGQLLTYGYTITNTGNVTLTGPFTVTDNRLGSFACGSGPVVPGATTSCSVPYTTTAADVTAGTLTNLATASGNGVTSNQAQATASYQQTILTGVVYDLATGLPLSGATVNVVDSAGHTYTVTTGADGRYTISDSPATPLATGLATVTASKPGYLTATATPTVVAGATTTQDLSLGYLSINGVVTDLGTGVPIVGATVTLTQGSTTCTTTTTAGGSYSFAYPGCQLVPGAATITDSADGYQSSSASPTLVASGPNVQNLAMGTADLIVTKSDSQTTVQPGQTLTYTLTVYNAGSITADAVTLVDVLPPQLAYVSDTSGVVPVQAPTGTWTWSLGSLAAGASKTFALVAQLATSLPDGTTTLTNAASVTTTSAEKDKSNNAVTDDDTVTTHPDLTIAKTYTSAPPATTGGVIAYQLAGGNIGHATATGVTVADTLDPLTTYLAGSAMLSINGGPPDAITPTSPLVFSLPDLTPGDTYVLTYSVTAGTVTGVPLTNTATIAAAQTDLNEADNTATISVPTEATSVDVYLLKAAVATSEPAVPGGQIVYTLTYGNSGAATAANVAITDAIPANTTLVGITGGGSEVAGVITWTLGELLSQATGTVSFTVQIASTVPPPVPPAQQVIVNTATIATTSPETSTDNNTATATTPLAAYTDMTITKTDGVTEVLTGDTLTYTITYQNVGNQTAAGVTIVDTLLAGVTYVSSSPGGVYDAGTRTVTWTIGNLLDFDPHTLSLTVTVDALPSTVAADRVTVSATSGPDPTPDNNTAADSNRVVAPYLVLEKRAPNPAYVGGQLVYTLDWRSTRAAPAYAATISDPLPAGTTLVPGSISCSGTSGGNPLSCSGSEIGGTVTWSLGDLSADASGSVSFAVTVGVTAGGAVQTAPTLTVEEGSGSVTVSSSASPLSLPWCEAVDNRCAAFKNLFQGPDGTQPVGWNDNPRMTIFDDNAWPAPVAASTAEQASWAVAANLPAEWVAPDADPHPEDNYTFFRQAFCLPLNATGLSASVDLAADDVADVYLNGVHLGQKTGSGAVDAFDGAGGIQTGINLVAVQLLNNRHGGHQDFGGADYIGLLLKAGAAYTGLRPFVYAPATVLHGQQVDFTVDDRAIGGRRPYEFKIDFGDGNTAPYQQSGVFAHTYAAPGTYTATMTARAVYGCTGTDTVLITVLPSGTTLLANQAQVAYADANGASFTGTSGAGSELLPAADVSAAVSAPSAATAGATATVTVTFANDGPSQADGLVYTITLPAGLDGVTCDGATCSYDAGTGVVTVTGLPAFLAPAGSTSLDLSYTTPPEGNVSITTTVSGSTFDPNSNNNTDSGSTPITPAADLALAKSASPDPVLVGELLTYTLSASNAGPSIAAPVTVTDTLPAGVTFISATGSEWVCTEVAGTVTCTRAALSVGSVRDIELVVAIGPGAATPLSNSATVTSATFDPNSANNTATVEVAALPSADLSIAKTAPETVTAGTNLTYTITVTNAGPSTATDVQAVESLPAGVIFVATAGCAESPAGGVPTCSLGSIAAGSFKEYTVTVAVGPTAIGSVANAVSVMAATSDPNPANNTVATDTIAVAVADVATTLTAPASAAAGSPATIQVGFANNGPSTADGVTYSVALPPGLSGVTCSVACSYDSGTGIVTITGLPGILAPGATESASVVYTAPPTGTVTATSTIATTTPESDLANNTASGSTLVTPAADLSVTKASYPDQYVPGALFTYTLTISNSGPSPALGARLQDPLPAALAGFAWTCAAGPGALCGAPGGSGDIDLLLNLAAGSQATITVTGTVPSGTVGALTNTATITPPAGTLDLVPGNNAASDTNPAGPQVNLTISKYSDPSPYVPGAPFTYTMVVTNDGPSDVTDARVQDVLPAPLAGFAWSCVPGAGASCAAAGGSGDIDTLVSLTAGASVTITVTGTVPSGTMGALTNTATVMPPAGTQELVPGNNTASNTNPVGPQADLTISKSPSAAEPVPGEAFSYTITASNNGPSDVTAARVQDVLPAPLAGFAWSCAADPGASCGTLSGVGDIDLLVSLMTGSSVTITVSGTIPSLVTGDLANTATVMPPAGTTDGNLADNRATASVTTKPSADLAVAKSVSTTVPLVGTNVVFTVTVTNNGPSDAAGVSVADALPSGYALVSVSPSVGSYSAGVWTVGSLASGASATLEITATVLATGDYTNSATVSSATFDPVAGNNTATAAPTPAAPAFTVAKSCASSEPLPQEGPALFTVTVTNTGNVPLTISADDGIGSFTLTAGQSRDFAVSVAGPFSGSATADNTVTASTTYTDTAGQITTITHAAGASCRVGSRVNLLKWSQGAVDPTRAWVFTVWSDGYGGTQFASGSTLGDLDGILTFDNVNLDRTQTYTLCEQNIPAGWTTFWQVDSNGDGVIDDTDAIVVPYNPNASDNPPQDLGNRCVNFGANTANPNLDLLTDGGTLLFMVNNTYPGGDPRTPGYWKNWNRCTGGGQAANADRNGGYQDGFWLLEDVLNPSVGGGIVWDDILADSFLYPITTCGQAVAILDQRDSDGSKHSSDAAYTLAMHLLAAQLNFGAGAKTCDAATDAALAGERLLDKYNFNDSGTYLLGNDKKVKADYALAVSLAATLDQYNNGKLCLGPAVSFVEPLDGAIITDYQNQLLRVTVIDVVPITQVEFFSNYVSLGVDNTASDGWSLLWHSDLVSDGSYTLKAVATNTLDQTGSGDVVVTVDNVIAPPTVAITSPAAGSTVTGSAVPIAASASSAVGVNQVEFFLDGALVGVDTSGADGWSTPWDSTTASDGSHSAGARATDSRGQSTDSAPVTVTVDNAVKPTVTVDSLAGSSSVVNKNTWRATVTITINPALSGAVVTGAWSTGGSTSCTTTNGVCAVVTNVSNKTSAITLTVNNIALAGYVFAPSPDIVTVSKP